MKAHPEFNERWLQQQIVDDVEILGLGELIVKDVERRQPHSGRLDLLLHDPESNTRYEVEIQLGATDESHIIRTLEYWDTEKRRFPQYDHVAVIVAEEITGRFLNVINLFNQAVPLIAIQMTALRVDEWFTLSATKVLDIALSALEEEDEPGQETDRSYWSSRTTSDLMKLLDQFMEVINSFGRGIAPKYNKHYIGLQRNGVPDNFITFRTRKSHLWAEFRIERSEELDARIEETGLDFVSYDKKWKLYRFKFTPQDMRNEKDFIVDLVRRARQLPSAPLAEDENEPQD